MILGIIWVKKIKSGNLLSVPWIVCTALYCVVYLDLFLVVFQQKQVLFLFLELEKDIALIIIAALMGYVGGKFSSSKTFEEKELP